MCIYIYIHLHICMYACMYACMYVCMHVCMYACMYVCMYAYMYAYRSVHLHTRCGFYKLMGFCVGVLGLSALLFGSILEPLSCGNSHGRHIHIYTYIYTYFYTYICKVVKIDR